MARRLVLAALAVTALTGCTATPQNTDLSPDTAPTLSRVAIAPGSGAAPAPTALAAPAAPGTVGRRSGPFDDRYELRSPALAGRAVTAKLVVTSDVTNWW